MSTIDYKIQVRSRRGQYLMAVQLHAAIVEGRITDAKDIEEAIDLITKAVTQLVRRKRLPPKEEAQLREQFAGYLG